MVHEYTSSSAWAGSWVTCLVLIWALCRLFITCGVAGLMLILYCCLGAGSLHASIRPEKDAFDLSTDAQMHRWQWARQELASGHNLLQFSCLYTLNSKDCSIFLIIWSNNLSNAYFAELCCVSDQYFSRLFQILCNLFSGCRCEIQKRWFYCKKSGNPQDSGAIRRYLVVWALVLGMS